MLGVILGNRRELWKVLEQRRDLSRGRAAWRIFGGKAGCLVGAEGFVGEFS